MSTDDLAPHQHELPNGRLVALGRPEVKTDPRTFRLAQLLLPQALPALPDRVVNSDKVSPWPMFANNRLGCCTASGAAHQWQLNAALTGQSETYTDDDVVRLYSASAGYNPADPTTDRGAVELDVLNYLRRNGFGDDKLAAFASVDPHDTDLVRHAIHLFGGVYIGLSLPRSAQAQDGGLWDVGTGPDGAAGSWGGHCVVACSYDFSTPQPTLECITWGGVQRMSLGFFTNYCDESYALVTEEWRQKSPAGFSFEALDGMLAQVGKVQA